MKALNLLFVSMTLLSLGASQAFSATCYPPGFLTYYNGGLTGSGYPCAGPSPAPVQPPPAPPKPSTNPDYINPGARFSATCTGMVQPPGKPVKSISGYASGVCPYNSIAACKNLELTAARAARDKAAYPYAQFGAACSSGLQYSF